MKTRTGREKSQEEGLTIMGLEESREAGILTGGWICVYIWIIWAGNGTGLPVEINSGGAALPDGDEELETVRQRQGAPALFS